MMHIFKRYGLPLFFGCILATSFASADVTLPEVFANHMVLQCDSFAPLWGSADPGEQVTVRFANQTWVTLADGKGKWSLKLNPLEASSRPRDLVVRGKNIVTLTDVLVGEVWICSGQSNMHWPLGRALSAEQAVPLADCPTIRLLNMQGGAYPSGHEFSDEELDSLTKKNYFTGTWTVCTPETAKDFSAVAYFFGRMLHDRLNVPVGLIKNAVGGSPTEGWISREALKKDPGLEPILENWLDNRMIQEWCRERARLNLTRPLEQKENQELNHPFKPCFLFEAGMEPLIPFAMRGVIWYQGESNGHNGKLHEKLFATLIRDWRKRWGEGHFPFLYVQLSAIGTSKGYKSEGWPVFREGQRRSLSIDNTGMAVTIDIGHPTDVHPRNKKDVGERLARWALKKTYGKDLVYSGPLYRSFTIKGKSLVLHFEHTGTWLATKDGKEPTGFEIAGKDGLFKPARAMIAGDTVVLSSPEVKDPKAARYAWAPYPECNLMNQEGLPASPFTTEKQF